MRGGRFSQRHKTDFLTTLEFNQISDPNFDASELDFGALWSSKSTTFPTLESTFYENADLKDILIFLNVKSTFWDPKELPGASKKRSKTYQIFYNFLTSILDRFWLILGP